MRCIFVLGGLFPLLVCNPTAFSQRGDIHRGSYIDDDDQRQLADLQFRTHPKNLGTLQIIIGATGPNVEPIGGFRGIRGGNRYTAEELSMILRGKHSVRVKTDYGGDEPGVVGIVSGGRTGRIAERRLLPNGRVDYLGTTAEQLPLELLVDTDADSPGIRTTLVIVNGQARLRCRYNIQNGRVTDLEVQSLGSDHHVAAAFDRHDRQHIPVAYQTAKLPVPLADWRGRDAEGRRALISKDLEQHPTHAAAWVNYLEKQKDFELLEWLAIYKLDFFRGQEVGAKLAKQNAPQWIRVAAWHCGGPPNFGHGLQIATSLLTQHNPAVAEHWMEKNQKRIDNWKGQVETHYKSLLQDKTKPKDSSALLPPLQPEHIFRHLDAPEKVVDFGNRKHVENDTVVYIHQVLSAIDAVVISGRRSDQLLAKVRKLIHHPNNRIRQAALLAFTYFAPQMPLTDRFEDFLAIAEDVNEPKNIAEAAVMRYSYHRHPAVMLKLNDIVADVNHPAWKAAASRLGDVGHSFSIDLFSRIEAAALSVEQKEILRGTLDRLQTAQLAEKNIPAWQMAQRAGIATCAKQTGSEYLPIIQDWLRKSFAKMNDDQQKVFAAGSAKDLGEIWTPGTAKEFAAAYEEIKADILNRKE